MMCVMLDAMAERYGQLPTHILRNADTLDLQVFDTAASYRQVQQQRAERSQNPSQYSQDDLLAATARMRNETGSN